MWSKFKALPVLPKVLIIVLVLGLLYKAGGSHHRTGSDRLTYASDYNGSLREASTDSRGSANHQALAQFQAEQVQLQARAAQCEREMTDATNRQAMAAMNGQFYNARPACEAQMPAYIARESYLETEIYRLQTGDTHSSMTEITGVQVGSRGDTPSARTRSNDGTQAVEDWDRGAIRGTSIYDDEEGPAARAPYPGLLLPRPVQRTHHRQQPAQPAQRRPRLRTVPARHPTPIAFISCGKLGFEVDREFIPAQRQKNELGFASLRKRLSGEGFVTGHDFSRANNLNRMNGL